jgi:hypothetical protein
VLAISFAAGRETFIPSSNFLPAAQRFGFMPAIDRWVIAQAAALAAQSPGRRLAVNLAANTIAEPGLVAYITQRSPTPARTPPISSSRSPSSAMPRRSANACASSGHRSPSTSSARASRASPI